MSYWDDEDVAFSTLLGKTLTKAEVSSNGEEIVFETTDGERFIQYHSQDCCESVRVEDVAGDLSDLIGSPILLAEETSSSGTADYDWSKDDSPKVATGWPEGIPVPEYLPDSFTWTFYKLATIKGSVTIRWLGKSNGYYSEEVSMRKVTQSDKEA
jgi:hypothetical protein